MIWTPDDIAGLTIEGVDDEGLQTIRTLLDTWRARYTTNLRRSLYYDTEQAFRDLGISLPPQLKQAKFVLGWATQAVRKPAMRSQFDGLRLPGSEDPFELGEILTRNHFPLTFGQSVVSAYTHGVALITVAAGLPGEVPVQIHAHSAEGSAAIWDRRARRVKAALTISDVKDDKPTAFVAYLADKILTIEKDGGGPWKVTHEAPNRTGRALAVAVTHDPQLRRPLGRSKLTRAVMALNDMAVRAYVRMEGNAEFYSSPQIALLGLDADAFSEGLSESKKFQLAQDRVLALTKDQEGDKPALQQLQQATMTPHSDMLRTVAMAFAGETGIPPSSLGVIHDQPASAEAIRANEHDLLIDATYQNQFVLGSAAVEVAQMVVMVRDNLAELPPEAWRLSAQFADEEFRSLSAKADAVQKLASGMEELVAWPVLLEQVFDSAQVQRIQEDSRRAAGRARLLEQLAGMRASPDSGEGSGTPVEDAQELKMKFEALGVAIRSGVAPENAAQILGLDQVQFTGAIPVSLRPLERDAGGLEDA